MTAKSGRRTRSFKQGYSVAEIAARVGYWILCALIIPVGCGEAWGWTAEEIAKGIQERYSQIRDLQADFHQETALPLMDRVKEAKGRIYLKIPGKMRWDYLEGQTKSVIINEKTLWFYQPNENQVTVTDLTRVPNAESLLTFLTGMGDLTRDFHLVPSPSIQETREGYVMIHLRPTEEGVQWTHLQLMVDPKTFQVVQTAFEGVQGDRTVIRYSRIRTDVGLPDELFEFQIPEGAEVLHYPPADQKP